MGNTKVVRSFTLDQGTFLFGLGTLLTAGSVAAFYNRTKQILAVINPMANLGMVYFVIALRPTNLKLPSVVGLLIANAGFLMVSGGLRGTKSNYYRSDFDKLFHLVNLGFYAYMVKSSLKEA